MSGEPGRGTPLAVEASAVVVSHNAREMLRACLLSLQGAPPRRTLEVIVVDNGSRDGSPEMVREGFPRVQIVENARNLGYAPACNQGMRRARGRHVLLLNPDVQLAPGAVDTLADFLEAHPDAGAAGGLLSEGDGSVQRNHVKALPSLRSALFGYRSVLSRWFPDNRFTRAELQHWRARSGEPFEASFVSTACLMVAREVLDVIGEMDDTFFQWVDADLCKRILDAGRRVYCLPGATGVHHQHRGGSMVSWRRRFATLADFHLGAYRYDRKHARRPAPARLLVALGLFSRFVLSAGLQTGRELAGAFRSPHP